MMMRQALSFISSVSYYYLLFVFFSSYLESQPLKLAALKGCPAQSHIQPSTHVSHSKHCGRSVAQQAASDGHRTTTTTTAAAQTAGAADALSAAAVRARLCIQPLEENVKQHKPRCVVEQRLPCTM